jgi:hypothetical protein
MQEEERKKKRQSRPDIIVMRCATSSLHNRNGMLVPGDWMADKLQPREQTSQGKMPVHVRRAGGG